MLRSQAKQGMRVLTLLSICCFFQVSFAAKLADYAPVPDISKRWNLAYYQDGDSPGHYQLLLNTLKGLVRLGWLDEFHLPAQLPQQSQILWAWLSANANSRYIRFLPNGYYSADWHASTRARVKTQLLYRLQKSKDVDLLLSSGSWGAADFISADHTTPGIYMAVKDAALLEKLQPTLAQKPYVLLAVDNLLYQRQLEAFEQFVDFNTLGLVVEDTDQGRLRAGMDTLNAFASSAEQAELKLVPCFTPRLTPQNTQQHAQQALIRCYAKLSQQVDAVYITDHAALNDSSLERITELVQQAQVPTFSQIGFPHVEKGVLMGLSQRDYGRIGAAQALNMAQIFRGATPGSLSGDSHLPAKFAINLNTATRIGYNPPLELLVVTDAIYGHTQITRIISGQGER